MPRTVRVVSAISDLLAATRGIVAGSGLATSEMRLVMIDIVDSALVIHPTVEPTFFVDDLSAELDGTDDDDDIVYHLSGFTEIVATRIAADGMEVSGTKSVISASHGQLGEVLMARLGRHGIKHAARVKSLGVGLGAGTRQNTQVMKTRLKNFSNRLPRFAALRRAGIDTAKLVRTGGDLSQ